MHCNLCITHVIHFYAIHVIRNQERSRGIKSEKVGVDGWVHAVIYLSCNFLTLVAPIPYSYFYTNYVCFPNLVVSSEDRSLRLLVRYRTWMRIPSLFIAQD